MKLLRLTTNYPKYLENFYHRNNNLESCSYDEQYRSLMKDRFGWNDVWTDSFNRLNYQVWEPVANAEIQQKRWAKENGINFSDKNWFFDITKAQVQNFKPDILFVNDYQSFTFDFLHELREECSSIKFILGWCGAPYVDSTVFKAYDLILTNLPYHKQKFSEQGHRVELMNHAFDVRVLDDLAFTKNQEFSFLGSITKGNLFHNERLELLIYLAIKTNIKIYADLMPTSYSIYRKIKIKYQIKRILNFLTQDNSNFLTGFINLISNYINFKQDYKEILLNSHPVELLKVSQAGLYGLDMYQKLGDSLFTFNQHINISKNSSNNMRLFEASGVGTCLLTEYTDDLSNLYEINQEIVTYKNKDELLEKIKYLKRNPKIAIEIGLRAQKRTLKDHSFFKRAEWLNDIIYKRIHSTSL